MSFPVLLDSRQPEVHASTLVLLEKSLLCAWFGGTKEGHSDVRIWLSRLDLSNPNSEWTTSSPVTADDGLPHWNPVLMKVPKSTKVLLFYKVGTPISAWYTHVMESDDEGTTWSEPRELVPNDRGKKPVSLLSLFSIQLFCTAKVAQAVEAP
jgi:predicted neuraminidase